MLAVEACFIDKLPSLFCPEDVFDLSNETIAILAAEDEESAAERARCSEKLKVLENGLRELKGVQGIPPATYYGITTTDHLSEVVSNLNRSSRHHRGRTRLDAASGS